MSDLSSTLIVYLPGASVETDFPFWSSVIVKPGPTVASSVLPPDAAVVVGVVFSDEFELDPPHPASAIAASATRPTSTRDVRELLFDTVLRRYAVPRG